MFRKVAIPARQWHTHRPLVAEGGVSRQQPAVPDPRIATCHHVPVMQHAVSPHGWPRSCMACPFCPSRSRWAATPEGAEADFRRQIAAALTPRDPAPSPPLPHLPSPAAVEACLPGRYHPSLYARARI